MTKALNDNFPDDPFICLAAATVKLMRRLQTHEQDEPRRPDGGSGDTDKEKADDQRRYVDRRLREIEIFEERAAGRQPWRRR